MHERSRLMIPTVVLAATLFAAPAHALFTGTLPLSKCLSGKLGCIAKAKTCLLTCHSKALKNGVAVDPTCVAKCRDKFEPDHEVDPEGCFTKMESAGDCGASLGNAGTVGARIDARVQELVRQINPTGAAVDNDCAARKLECVRKYDKCVLDQVRKAMKSATPIGDLSKCTRFLDGTDRSCVGKVELKYCDPESPGCNSDDPPCLTRYDQGVLRNQDDAFVDDVIQTLVTGPTAVNTQRCSEDTSVVCDNAPGGLAGCGGALGTCEFFLGPPQPLSLGIAVCQVLRWDGPVTGTFDEATGGIAGTETVAWRSYTSGLIEQPCPVCAGDPYANDGVAGGTCVGGTRNGLGCDGNGRSSEPSFGITSLDCPPNPAALLTDARVSFSTSNDGTLAKTVTPASPNCNGAAGKKCLCATCSLDSTIACENDAECASASAGACTNPAGEPRRPNACVDSTADPGDGSRCAAVGNGEGACPEGPVETRCAIETFRGCNEDADCPTPNDHCIGRLRDCFPGYDGNVGDTIETIGVAAPARNGAAATLRASLGCRPASSSSMVNTVVGAPGPIRWQIDGVGGHDGGPGCPTRLSFSATSEGPALDFGWTGIVHDQHVTGGLGFTVATTCTGTHPNCACTYTGPIPNPNAP